MPDDRLAFFELAREALGTTQEALGKRLGVSRRTAQRWGASGIRSYELTDLMLPHDRALAVKTAAAAGTTLEAAGIEESPPPPAPPPDGVVDAVVCAAFASERAALKNLFTSEALRESIAIENWDITRCGAAWPRRVRSRLGRGHVADV